MDLAIDYNHPVLDRERAEALTFEDLGNFYRAATEVDRLNLFFVLLTSLQRYEEEGDAALAARLSFLTAEYLFTILTPPGSWPLAMHYIGKAARLDPREEYRACREWMEGGN